MVKELDYYLGIKGGCPKKILKKNHKLKSITSKIVKNKMSNSSSRRKVGYQIRPKDERTGNNNILYENPLQKKIIKTKQIELIESKQKNFHQDFTPVEIKAQKMKSIIEEEAINTHESEMDTPSEDTGTINIISKSLNKSPGKTSHLSKKFMQIKS